MFFFPDENNIHIFDRKFMAQGLYQKKMFNYLQYQTLQQIKIINLSVASTIH